MDHDSTPDRLGQIVHTLMRGGKKYDGSPVHFSVVTDDVVYQMVEIPESHVFRDRPEAVYWDAPWMVYADDCAPLIEEARARLGLDEEAARLLAWIVLSHLSKTHHRTDPMSEPEVPAAGPLSTGAMEELVREVHAPRRQDQLRHAFGLGVDVEVHPGPGDPAEEDGPGSGAGTAPPDA
jgi:hypothetical protein